jgi:hypothetical protein
MLRFPAAAGRIREKRCHEVSPGDLRDDGVDPVVVRSRQ